MKNVAVVGAGFTGAIIANELAEAGYVVDVFERRGHVAGNCFTYRDSTTGIMIHAYGPHIFHTSNKKVWDYITKWDEFIPYVQRTKAVVANRVYSLPINLHTINQFFGENLNPHNANEFIVGKCYRCRGSDNFELEAWGCIGKELYEAFFKGYTEKQWGMPPNILPASILKRLPLRFDYDDNYFNDTYQAMPKHGYTHIVEKMLNHPRIRVKLRTAFRKDAHKTPYDHVFYSGPLDAWFDYSIGHLRYRSLKFELIRQDGDYQGCAIMNYCDASVPWTRITEHKHFEPWAKFDQTVAFKEFSRATNLEDEPFYPLRLVNDKKLLDDYVDMAAQETNVTFVGRLGTYRYLDMHQAMLEALETAEMFIERGRTHSRMPQFRDWEPIYAQG